VMLHPRALGSPPFVVQTSLQPSIAQIRCLLLSVLQARQAHDGQGWVFPMSGLKEGPGEQQCQVHISLLVAASDVCYANMVMDGQCTCQGAVHFKNRAQIHCNKKVMYLWVTQCQHKVICRRCRRSQVPCIQPRSEHPVHSYADNPADHVHLIRSPTPQDPVTRDHAILTCACARCPSCRTYAARYNTQRRLSMSLQSGRWQNDPFNLYDNMNRECIARPTHGQRR
jgi:hypothetical protein